MGSSALRAGAVLAALLVAAIAVALLPGYPSAQAQSLIDYDSNNNGLIEIANLAQLNVVRHDADGNGDPSSDGSFVFGIAFPKRLPWMGCPDTDFDGNGDCTGYELEASLDFDTNGNGVPDSGDTYWNGGSGWTPIPEYSATFQGNANTLGKRYTISNLHVNLTGSGVVYAGLFGDVGAATIENVGITSGSVYGKSTDGAAYAGGLAGNLAEDSRVAGSYAHVTVTAQPLDDAIGYAGGLAGYTDGAIVNSYATGDATVADQDATSSIAYAGGLVGRVAGNGSVTGSHAAGNADAVGDSTAAGGLVGESVANVSDSYSTGNATASSGSPGSNAYAGGLVGFASATIFGSYATGDATATASADNQVARAGGLVGGKNGGAVTASYARGAATATATGTGGDADAGGLIGAVTDGSTVTASYATGNASANAPSDNDAAEKAGGLVGNAAVTLTVNASYATGRPSLSGSAGDADNSGKFGLVGAANVTAAASYWDTVSSGVAATAGGAGTGTPTLVLQAPTSTSTPDAGNPYATWGDTWEFGTDWQYPILVHSTSTKNSVQRPTVSLSVSPASISENRGVSTLSATLEPTSNVATQVAVSFSGSEENVLLDGTTITIQAGQASGSVGISTVDDAAYTGSRSVTFSGRVQPGGAGPQAHPADVTMTLEDDETTTPTDTTPTDPSGSTPPDGTATPEPTATPAPTATPIPVTVVPDSQITPVAAPEMGTSGTIHPDQSATLTSGNVSVTFPPRSRPWSFQATLDTSADACASAPNTSGVQLPCATVQIYDTSGSAESNVVLLAPAQIRIELTAEQVEALGGVVALYTAHKAGA